MEQKIGEIREILQAASVDELPAFIAAHEKDERAGVQALINKAKKRRLDYEKELLRTEKMKEYERKYASFSYICGIDEVGRGPLAGPVVAGAVILPRDCRILYLNDSKQLSEKKREELYEVIMEMRFPQDLALSRRKELTRLIFCRLPMKPCARPSGNWRKSRISY